VEHGSREGYVNETGSLQSTQTTQKPSTLQRDPQITRMKTDQGGVAGRRLFWRDIWEEHYYAVLHLWHFSACGIRDVHSLPLL
jgi:hypothetical protein